MLMTASLGSPGPLLSLNVRDALDHDFSTVTKATSTVTRLVLTRRPIRVVALYLPQPTGDLLFTLLLDRGMTAPQAEALRASGELMLKAVHSIVDLAEDVLQQRHAGQYLGLGFH